MQSPTVEWALGIGYLIAVDALRDRGEPDGDTLTECLRSAFHTETVRGRAALAASMIGGGVVLWRHLVKPAASTPDTDAPLTFG